MGARVYNPETNQFTSPDPVKGGNENTYTYPNDPVNKFDFSGLISAAQKLMMGTADFLIGIAMFAIGSLACGEAIFACYFISGALGGFGDFLSQLVHSFILTGSWMPKGGLNFTSIIEASLSAVLTSIVGTGMARYLASKFTQISEKLIEFLTDFSIDTALSRPAANASFRVAGTLTRPKSKGGKK